MSMYILKYEKAHRFFLYQLDDEWFYIFVSRYYADNHYTNAEDVYKDVLGGYPFLRADPMIYKCDQFDGVLNCLKNEFDIE